MDKLDIERGTCSPLLHWQYFDGAIKFERNSRHTLVDDLELGFDWQPMPALELTALYAMLDRTNVIELPNEQFEGDLLRFPAAVALLIAPSRCCSTCRWKPPCRARPGGFVVFIPTFGSADG
jgi:hypothetical protein